MYAEKLGQISTCICIRFLSVEIVNYIYDKEKKKNKGIPQC